MRETLTEQSTAGENRENARDTNVTIHYIFKVQESSKSD